MTHSITYFSSLDDEKYEYELGTGDNEDKEIKYFIPAIASISHEIFLRIHSG